MGWWQSILKRVGHMQHPLLWMSLTLTCPRLIFRAFYCEMHRDGLPWNGKRCAVTLSFDCDYPDDMAALPSLLDRLAAYQLPASFACIGRWIEQYPDIYQRIVQGGHEIVNHTYSHPNNEDLNPDHRFNELTVEEQRDEVIRCHEVCREVLQYEPVGFRTPHFGQLHTETVYPILHDLGYQYSSSTMVIRTPTLGAPFQPIDGLWEFPVSPCPEHPFGVFDTWHGFRGRRAWHRRPGDFSRLFAEALEMGIRHGAYLNFYFDPRDMETDALGEQLFACVQKVERDVWVVNYTELAAALDEIRSRSLVEHAEGM